MNEEKQTEQEEEESGVSIRDIFRTIGKRIWWVFAGSVALALAAVLIFMFAINPARKTSSKSFQMSYPFSESEQYPDGSAFNYRDIVSKDVLQRAIGGNSSFSSLDVDTLIKNDAVSISAEKENKETDSAYIYTVTLKNSYFKNVDTEDFIDALSKGYASFVAQKALNMNYSINDTTFESASFKDQLLLLDQQKEIILAQYNKWIGQYNAGYVIDGKSLGNYRTEAMVTLADNVRGPIENDLKIKGYEHFHANVVSADVKTCVEYLETQATLNRSIIEELKKALNGNTEENSSAGGIATYAQSSSKEEGTGSTTNITILPGDSNLSQKLASYIEQNEILEAQIEFLKSGAVGDNYDAVAAKINTFGEETLGKHRDDLNDRANDLKSAISTIYLNDTFFVYTTQRATSSGGTSILLVAAAVFVVAFIVLLVVSYFVGKKSADCVKTENPAAEGTGEHKE